MEQPRFRNSAGSFQSSPRARNPVGPPPFPGQCSHASSTPTAASTSPRWPANSPAFDAASGHIRLDLQSRRRSLRCAVCRSDHRLTVRSADHHVYAVNLSDGFYDPAVMRKTRTAASIGGPAAVRRGVVCVGSADTNIYGLRPPTAPSSGPSPGKTFSSPAPPPTASGFSSAGGRTSSAASTPRAARNSWSPELGKKQTMLPNFSAFAPAIATPAVGEGSRVHPHQRRRPARPLATDGFEALARRSQEDGLQLADLRQRHRLRDPQRRKQSPRDPRQHRRGHVGSRDRRQRLRQQLRLRRWYCSWRRWRSCCLCTRPAARNPDTASAPATPSPARRRRTERCT